MESLKHQPSHETYLLLNGLLLAQRGKLKEALLFLHHLVGLYSSVDDHPNLTLLYSLLTLYQESHASKYALLMQRNQMRALGILPPVGTFRESPIPSELPLQHPSDHPDHVAPPSLDQDQLDTMYSSIIQTLYSLNQICVADKFLPEVKTPSISISIIQAQMLAQNGQLEESVQQLESLLESNKSDVQLLKQIGDLCFEFKQYDRCYDIYIQLLRQKQSDSA